MAFAEGNGARIYWRSVGSGEPLLLVMGFGYPASMWHHVEPRLAERLRVVLFDHRGIGRSGMAPGPHEMSTLAADAAAVLDAAGVARAHVFGVSMGGYVAQELALRHPERVGSLVLGATSCGGAHAVAAGRDVQEAFASRRGMPVERAVRVMIPYIYDPKTPAERIEADLAIRREAYPAVATQEAQLEGIRRWESYERLAELSCPTLVIHGEHDRLVPPENGRLLADRIPGARLRMLPDASHIFFTDQPEATVAAIVDFLSGGARQGAP
ncbi:MAG: alpha/beta hydrolase [Acidobacteria bacterium]|nr:alpha/beta hydrolase [Acidobacteriota bacterium]MCB9377780.1 alpha/beta hydrolase [Holophagales bacterium]